MGFGPAVAAAFYVVVAGALLACYGGSDGKTAPVPQPPPRGALVRPLHLLKRPNAASPALTLMCPPLMAKLSTELGATVANAGAVALTLVVRLLVVGLVVVVACSADGRAEMGLGRA